MKAIRWVMVAASVVLACSDSPVAPANDLGVVTWADVEPNTLSASDSTAKFVVRINVYNPTGHDIVLKSGPPWTFTTDPANTVGVWGSMRIARDTNTMNAGPNWDSYRSGDYVIPRHTTVSTENETTLAGWKSGGWPLTPGTYQVRVWFYGREGTGADLTLLP